MEPIQTFIFMDLETTGLPHQSTTKITEMSLVAASRKHILEKHNEFDKENKFGNPNPMRPRVLNKINFTFYPCKMIEPMASVVSGLTNDNLENQRPFDTDMYKIMVLFMERLEKPVCLVAHNGNRFDFPVLQSELAKISKTLPEDVVCADSLPGFRDVLSDQLCPGNLENNDNENTVLSDIKPLNNIVNPSCTLPKCEWSNEEYDNEMAQVTELAEKLTEKHNSFNVDELEIKIQVEMERVRKTNERTPTRKNRKLANTNSKEGNNPRRRILNEKQLPKRQYNMKALYESLTGKDLVDAHQAEADTLALLECVTAVGRPILEWMDRHRLPFRSIKKLW